MKKIILTALAVVLSASIMTADAAKKKTSKTTKRIQKELPASPATSSDTLSYVAGVTMTNGLAPYLKEAYGIDSTNADRFMEGMLDYFKAENDPKMKAYAAGLQIANQLKNQMVAGIRKEFTDTPDTIVTNILYRGFVDAFTGDTTVCDMSEAEAIFNAKRESNKAAKEEFLYGANRKKGEAFLAENAKKDSVIVTPSGLQYKVLVMGDGEKPKAADKVKVHYEGTLIDGTVFDASRRHSEYPLSFHANQVIKGWTEALTMMPVGSKWQLFIPQDLGYGARQAGQIPPYSTLIFTVELLGIEK